MAMQHLRSNTASKRPTPASMADGQLAINTNATSPGLFFKDAGGSLIKIGPVHVGTSAPNSSPAGSSGNAIGEQWLDTSGGGYAFKVWDGSAWRSEAGEFVDVTGDTMTGDLTISGADLVMSNGEIIAATGAETTPSITFDGDTNTGLYSPGADQVAVTTGGTGRLFVDGSGNVGIGASSPEAKLDITSGTGPTDQALLISDSASIPVDTDFTAQISTYGQDSSALSGSKGGLYVQAGFNRDTDIARFSSIGTGYADVPRMVIKDSGNVGIGASSPGYRLDVNSGTTDTIVGRLKSTSTTTAYMTVEASGTTLGSVRFGATGDEMALWSGSGETMRLDSSGNVGIGESDPQSVLDVSSPNSNTDEVVAGFGNQTIQGGLQVITNGNLDWGFNAKNSRNLVFETNQTERMRIDSSGNVGIGATSPAATLDLNGNYTSNVTAVSALNIDCSAGNYFTKTINANSTFTFSNVPSSRAYSFTLELTHTSGTVTWPTSVEFPDDTAPTLTTGKTHLFMFITDDGGTRFRGAALVDYDN